MVYFSFITFFLMRGT